MYTIYNPTIYYLRKCQWEEITEFGKSVKDAWLLVGNFNQILCASKKLGGNSPKQYKMDSFCDFINRNGPIDLKSCGLTYTWSNLRRKLLILAKLY